MGVLNKILNTKNNEFDCVAILPSALEYRYVTNASIKNNINECAKWQEQWEQTDSNLKHHSKERRPRGHTLPWRANRVRSGRQAATTAAKHLWGYRESKRFMCGAATCDLNHIMTSCIHFGERPSLDDIAEMKDGYVRWPRANCRHDMMMINECALLYLRHHIVLTPASSKIARHTYFSICTLKPKC